MAAALHHPRTQPRALDLEASLANRTCLKGTQSRAATPLGAQDLDLGSRIAVQGASPSLGRRKTGQRGAPDLGPSKQAIPTPTPCTAK
eukprot:7187396-Heterocapsa_arctica.AAC.1